MPVDSIYSFYPDSGIRNGSAVTSVGGQHYIYADRAFASESGVLNESAKYVAEHPRYYTGDTDS